MESMSACHQDIGNPETEPPFPARRSSVHTSRKTSWGTPIPPPSNTLCYSVDKSEALEAVELDSEKDASVMHTAASAWNNLNALGLSFSPEPSQIPLNPQNHRFSLDDNEITDRQKSVIAPNGHFDKWMRALHRRAISRRKTITEPIDRPLALEMTSFLSNDKASIRSHHKKSSSSSSLGFVTAVKSASISLASFSIAPRSRRTGASSRHQNRSSKASNAGGRFSEDSAYIPGRAVIDEAVMNRSIQRRKILEEIISTEESYVADIKFLMNVSMSTLLNLHKTHLSQGIRHTSCFNAHTVHKYEVFYQQQSQRARGLT